MVGVGAGVGVGIGVVLSVTTNRQFKNFTYIFCDVVTELGHLVPIHDMCYKNIVIQWQYVGPWLSLLPI